MRGHARKVLAAAVLSVGAALGFGATQATAEDLSNLDNGHRLLIQNGLQVIGLVNTGDVFHQSTYQAANYTSVLWWLAGSNPSAAPNMPWARAVVDQSTMPDKVSSENGAYMN